MLPDTVIRRVAGKEMTLFFASPVAWLFLGSFAAVSLFVFFWGEAFFARNIADVRPLFEWMPILLIFLCSALTMRMWSEERRTGTLEYLLSLPVALWRFVLGKFLACLALLCLALLITILLPLTVANLGNLDWGPVVAAYLATLLLGSAYLAIGLFVSARSDNPIVSLIGSVAICSLFYLVGSSTVTSLFGNLGGELLRSLGTGARFDDITRGVLDLRDLVYYLSLVAIFLSLNIYSLEQERWSKLGRRESSSAMAAGHGPAAGQRPGGKSLVKPIDRRAPRRYRGPSLLHLRRDPSIPVPVAGAAVDARLLQRQDAPPAGAPGATVARPDERV